MDSAREQDTALHLIGLLSDGGVHSHNTHLYALLKMAKLRGLTRVCPLSDGRQDVHAFQRSGLCAAVRGADQADRHRHDRQRTGRYYGMDRDNIWPRVELGYNAIALGEGIPAHSAEEAMSQSYDKGETDEFVKPTVIFRDGKPAANRAAARQHHLL